MKISKFGGNINCSVERLLFLFTDRSDQYSTKTVFLSSQLMEQSVYWASPAFTSLYPENRSKFLPELDFTAIGFSTSTLAVISYESKMFIANVWYHSNWIVEKFV